MHNPSSYDKANKRSVASYDEWMGYNLNRGLGKWNLVEYLIDYLVDFDNQNKHGAHILEIGCGGGQVLGLIEQAIGQMSAGTRGWSLVGIDKEEKMLKIAREKFPNIMFVHGDAMKIKLSQFKGKQDVVILCNVLHEITSSMAYKSGGLQGMKRVAKRAVKMSVTFLKQDGILAIYDGVDLPKSKVAKITLRFKHKVAREQFEHFVKSYMALREKPIYLSLTDVEVSREFFVKFITTYWFMPAIKKSWEQRELWLPEPTKSWIRQYREGDPIASWERQRWESYQYFDESDFEETFANEGLKIIKKKLITDFLPMWHQDVEILTRGAEFPANHIMIVGKLA